MFLVGSKDKGAVYVPEHPTFLRFLLDAPSEGWAACTLSGEPRAHRSRAGPCREDRLDLHGLRAHPLEVVRGLGRPRGAGSRPGAEDGSSASCAENLEKVVVENRCNSAQPPGETLVSLYLVTGLLANLDESFAFALEEPYDFWKRVLAGLHDGPDGHAGGRPLHPRVRQAHDRRRAARLGRCAARPAPDGALDTLDRRIDESASPAERLLQVYRSGGTPEPIGLTRLRAAATPRRGRRSALEQVRDLGQDLPVAVDARSRSWPCSSAG